MSVEHQPRAARRTGYVVAAVINIVLLWVANRLLEWEWPPFLTAEYDDLLPWIRFSLLAMVAANLVWVVRDPAWFRHLGQAALNAITFVVALRTWQLFPFDFATYSEVWEVGARVLIAIGVIGGAIGAVAELGRFVAAAGRSVHLGPPRPA